MCNDELIKFLIYYLNMLRVDNEEVKQILPIPNTSIFYTLCRYFGINELANRFDSNADFYEKLKSTMVGHLNSATYEDFDEMDSAAYEDFDEMDDEMDSAINKEFNEIMTINLEGHNRSKLIQHFRNIATTLDKSKIESFVIIYNFLDYILLLLENKVNNYFDKEIYRRIKNYYGQMIKLKNARESGFLTLGQGTRAGPDEFSKIILRHKNGLQDQKNVEQYYKKLKKHQAVCKNTHENRKNTHEKLRNQTRKESESSEDDEYSGGKRRRRKTYKKSRRKNSKKTRRK